MKIFFFFFQPHLVACRILVPGPGIEPRCPQWKLPSPDPWTTREFPLRILSSHFLGHLPNPWLETIQVCLSSCWQNSLSVLFQNFHLNAFGFSAGRREPVDFQQRFCDLLRGWVLYKSLGCTKRNHARIPLWERWTPSHNSTRSEQFPVVVIFPPAPSMGPVPVAHVQRCWPTQTRHVVGLHSQAKRSCTSKLSASPPEACFSSALIFAFYFWLVAACLVSPR